MAPRPCVGGHASEAGSRATGQAGDIHAVCLFFTEATPLESTPTNWFRRVVPVWYPWKTYLGDRNVRLGDFHLLTQV